MTATTELCHATADEIVVRGKSLPRELIGRRTFTELIHLALTGREPTAAQTAVLDACLVTLMEHGLTPSAIATRLVYGSAPEAMQGAVAAGLLAVGSVFVGTTEGCAALLARVVRSPDSAAEAAAIVAEARAAGARLPGFGHPVHRPVDPRTVALLALAREVGGHGAHCEALAALSAAVDAAAGKPVPVNATGAVAALLCDAGLPPAILRGIALISRCAGLVAHVREEQETPAMRALWEAGEAAVPYQPGAPAPAPAPDAAPEPDEGAR
ncbi:MAG TPA: citryl-CoA lyase [Kofleriaceae bacterium]|nr:citryl-CoA lyase [Kofleriaceae bacterium]